MRGGSNVYLMNETLVKLPVEIIRFMQTPAFREGLQHNVSRMGTGVSEFVDNLVGYTVYPGPFPKFRSDMLAGRFIRGSRPAPQ